MNRTYVHFWCDVDPARTVGLGTVCGCETEHHCRAAPPHRCCLNWHTGCSGRCSRPGPGSCWTTTACSTTPPVHWCSSPPGTTSPRAPVANNIAAVRAAGLRIPLSAPLIAEATRGSTQDDDHLGRARIATTLGLPTPAAASVDHPTTVGAVRLLTAVGPLNLPAVAAAIARTRRFRNPFRQ